MITMDRYIEVLEVRKESAIITYNNQFFCLHNYGHPNKSKFRHFKEIIIDTPLTIDEIYRLSWDYEVTFVSATTR